MTDNHPSPEEREGPAKGEPVEAQGSAPRCRDALREGGKPQSAFCQLCGYRACLLRSKGEPDNHPSPEVGVEKIARMIDPDEWALHDFAISSGKDEEFLRVHRDGLLWPSISKAKEIYVQLAKAAPPKPEVGVEGIENPIRLLRAECNRVIENIKRHSGEQTPGFAVINGLLKRCDAVFAASDRLSDTVEALARGAKFQEPDK